MGLQDLLLAFSYSCLKLLNDLIAVQVNMTRAIELIHAACGHVTIIDDISRMY